MGQTYNIFNKHDSANNQKLPDKKSSPPSFPKNYPKCKDCQKNHVSKKFKSSTIMLCENCYLKRKKKMYEQDILFKGTVQIDEITPKLYLGNNEGAKSKDELHKLGITHILVVGYYLHEYYPEEFKYKTIEIEDNDKEKIINYLLPAIEFIDRADKCFVHCRAGVSRSSTIVIGYLMLVNKMSYESAREFVGKKRNVIEPNENFVQQLQQFGDILNVCNYKYRLIKEFLRTFVVED